MSRIGQKPILVPDKVKVTVQGAAIAIEGPRGKLKHTLPSGIEAALQGKELLVKKTGETRQHKALHGLSRALLANFVQGANEGFKKQLEIQGAAEPELRQTVEKFRAEELEHRDIGLEQEAEQAPGYLLLSRIIKAGCRAAIALSERI